MRGLLHLYGTGPIMGRGLNPIGDDQETYTVGIVLNSRVMMMATATTTMMKTVAQKPKKMFWSTLPNRSNHILTVVRARVYCMLSNSREDVPAVRSDSISPYIILLSLSVDSVTTARNQTRSSQA